MNGNCARVLIIGLLLGACSTDGPSAPQPHEASTTTSSSATRTAPPGANVSPAELQPEQIVRVPPPDWDSLRARLMGRDAPGVVDLIGEPNWTRRDEPARVWQYRGERCILDVFLYADGESHVVRHLALRSTEVTQPGDTECLGDIFKGGAPAG